MSNVVQRLVSKKKRRFNAHGFDLDMSYISEHIIAMGYPSENVEAMYRNPYKKVYEYFERFHKDRYKVYNLCSERQYEPSKFHNRVECFPFDDHNAPPFELIFQFCESVKEWLSKNDENIALIHCKAGKGRTGVMICNWLMYTGEWNSPEDAMAFYAAMRTLNMKGVTIPSQIRYIHYFAKGLVRQELPVDPDTYRPAKLGKITLHTIPMVDGPIYFEMQHKKKQFYVYSGDEATSDLVQSACKRQKARLKADQVAALSPLVVEQENGCERLSFTVKGEDGGPVEIKGDILVQFYEGKPGKAEKLFHVWINSHYVDEHTIMPKKTVDKAHKDKQDKIFLPNFHLQFDFVDLEPVKPIVHKKESDSRGDRRGDRRLNSAATDLANRRGHERNSRPGTLEPKELVLNAGPAPSKKEFFDKHGLDGLVDTSPCALAAYLCERAVEALEQHAETAVGGAALAAAASSSLAPTDANSSTNSTKTDVADASKLRVVGIGGMLALAESSSLTAIEDAARMLQHVDTLPSMRHAQRVSFWVNVYNSLSVHTSAVYRPTTLRERLHAQLYYKYQIGKEKYSMAEIQIFMLRNTLPQSPQLERLLRERIEWRKKNAVLPGALLSPEPIVTFCINNGVPAAGEIVPLWPDNIEEQLNRASRRYFNRLFRVDRKAQRALLPRSISWVRQDFGRDRAERLAILGQFMDPDQRKSLFECGKRASGFQYTHNDQTLGYICPSVKRDKRGGRSSSKSRSLGHDRRHSSAMATKADGRRPNEKLSKSSKYVGGLGRPSSSKKAKKSKTENGAIQNGHADDNSAEDDDDSLKKRPSKGRSYKKKRDKSVPSSPAV